MHWMPLSIDTVFKDTGDKSNHNEQIRYIRKSRLGDLHHHNIIAGLHYTKIVTPVKNKIPLLIIQFALLRPIVLSKVLVLLLLTAFL